MLDIDLSDLQAAGDAWARPFAHSYWLLPGRLLAGAHPAARDAESVARHLRALHEHGVTCCIDLTAPRDALSAYQPLDGRRLNFPIADFGLPSVQGMRATLDAIAHSLAGGEGVYLHCRAGIGRTGTVAACWLVEQGLSGADALDLLQAKFRASSQGRMGGVSPETLEQRAFVHDWAEAANASRATGS